MKDRVLLGLLRDLSEFLDQVEHCSECVPPGDAFDGKHAKEWAVLKKRLDSVRRQLDSN